MESHILKTGQLCVPVTNCSIITFDSHEWKEKCVDSHILKTDRLCVQSQTIYLSCATVINEKRSVFDSHILKTDCLCDLIRNKTEVCLIVIFRKKTGCVFKSQTEGEVSLIVKFSKTDSLCTSHKL